MGSFDLVKSCGVGIMGRFLAVKVADFIFEDLPVVDQVATEFDELLEGVVSFYFLRKFNFGFVLHKFFGDEAPLDLLDILNGVFHKTQAPYLWAVLLRWN